MKTFRFVIAILLCSNLAQAKKVKFAVDMSGLTINSTSVHVMGDFQSAAGFGANWTPGSTVLTKEGSTDIYSIVVDIPAFKRYEFRFLNGDQTYEAEFVPEKCRVDEFNDNRWLYVDSLSNDTSFLGAVIFAGTSPAGKTLLRYKVDMRVAGSISANGVHVGTSYQASAYSASARRMTDITSGIYEIIDYVTTGSYSFIYYNGNTLANSETVPSGCATNNKRTVVLSSDTVLNAICFSSCAACVGVGIAEVSANNGPVSIYPNPTAGELTIVSSSAGSIRISDMQGRSVYVATTEQGNTTLQLHQLQAGIYLLHHSASNKVEKLVIQ